MPDKRFNALDLLATLVLVVAGLVVSAFFQALVSLTKIVADPLNQLPSITFWLLGGLARTTPATLLGALVPIAAAANSASSSRSRRPTESAIDPPTTKPTGSAAAMSAHDPPRNTAAPPENSA